MRNKIWIFFSTLILLTGMMLVCSLATSPLYPHNFSYDSAFFRFFGKEILEGKTPYTDIWDHKGPVLYFIQALGAIGGTTNKGTNVLFMMQLISLFLSVYFMYKIYQLSVGEKAPLWTFPVILICTSSVFSLTIESGNLSEEWCLPMICCSFYLMVIYASNTETDPKHPLVFSFLHGIDLGLMLLIRANNALPVCAGLFVIGMYLLYKKCLKNAIANIFFGLLGIALVWIPIFGWYSKREALSEMIYATFTFNLKYAQFRSYLRFSGEPFVTRYLPVLTAILIFIVHWYKIRCLRFVDWIVSAILITSVWLLRRTNVYLHYFTIFVPVLFFVLIFCADRIGFFESTLMLIFCIWFGWQNIHRIPNLITLHRQPPMFTETEKIPLDERNSVIAVNMPPEVYLNYGLEPVSRFCAYQHVHFGTAPELKTEFLDTLRNDPPKWILAFCSGENHIPEVQEMIDHDYIYRFDQSDICYYQHK